MGKSIFFYKSCCLKKFLPLHPKSSWCIRGKTRDKLEAMLMKARHSFLTLYFLVSKGGTSGHHQKQSTNTLPINGLIMARLLSEVAGPTTDHWYHAYFVARPCQSRDHHLLGVWFPSRHGFEYIVPRRSRRSPIDFFASSASLRATSGATSFAYAGRGWGLQPPLRGRGPHFQWASTLRAIPTSLLVVRARLLWCRVGCMVGFWMVSPVTAYCRETRRAIVLWWSLLFMVLDVGTFVVSGKENCSVG